MQLYVPWEIFKLPTDKKVIAAFFTNTRTIVVIPLVNQLSLEIPLLKSVFINVFRELLGY